MAGSIGQSAFYKSLQSWADGRQSPPPLYQVMAYQGQGIFLTRFFGVLRSKVGLEVSDTHWLAFYQECVLSGGFVLDLINRCHWLQVLSQGAALPAVDSKQALWLYYILVAVLAQRNPDRLALAIDDYFLHIWRQRFPADVSLTQKHDTSQLKHKLVHRLRRLRSLPCEVKESFVQAENMVHFRLLYREDKKSAWQTLIQIERPRLKSARLAAYEALDDDALRDFFKPPTLHNKTAYLNTAQGLVPVPSPITKPKHAPKPCGDGNIN